MKLKHVFPEDLDFPSDSLAEKRLLCCVILGVSDATQAVFCDLESDDFFVWPHDILYEALREAWQAGMLKNAGQAAKVIVQARPRDIPTLDWGRIVGTGIIRAMFKWPIEFMWRDDFEKLTKLAVRREESRLLALMLSKVRNERRYPGECLHDANIATERIAMKVAKCVSGHWA